MEPKGKGGQHVSISGMVSCPKCAHSNVLGTRYCDNCGASLAGVAAHQDAAQDRSKRRMGGLFGRKDRAA